MAGLATSKVWRTVLPWVLFVALALGVTAPMFRAPRAWGIHDWAQFYTYYGVPRRAVAEDGELPGWNPHFYGGNVQWGHPDDPTLSPLFILILAFGEVVGSKLAVVAVLAGGMASMWYLLRHLGASATGSIFAAVVWGLNGWHAYHFAVGHMDHLTFLFQPLAVLFLLKACQRIKWSAACGAVVALMFLSGGPYPFVFTVLLLGVLALVFAGAGNSVKPIKAAALSLLFALGIAMVKLLGTLEFTLYAETSPVDVSGTPLGVVWKALFDPSVPLVDKYLGLPWGGWEYAAFVGFIPAALLAVGVFKQFRKAWPWLIVAIVFFVAALGNRSPVDFFALFTAPPGLSGMHVPFRFIVHVILAGAVVGAFGLDWLVSKVSVTAPRRLVAAAAALVVAVAAGNLIWMHYHRPTSLYGLASMIPRPREDHADAPRVDGAGSGRQGEPETVPITSPQTLKVYMTFLENRRLPWGYDANYLRRAAHMEGEEGYRGEAYFANAELGAVRRLDSTMSRYTVSYEAEAEAIVVLNQNYHPGWKVSGALEGAFDLEGLVAARVPAGEGVVTFRYAPTSRVAGAAVTLLTLFAALYMVTKTDGAKGRGRGAEAAKVVS